MRFFLLLSFFTAFHPLFSQDSLKQAVIYFPVKNVVVYLDGHKIESSQKSISIEKGMHQIKIWAPTYNLMEDSFMVKKNKTFYSKRLHHSGAYRGFVAKRWLRSSTAFVPPVLTILYCLRLNTNLDDASSTMANISDSKREAKMRLDVAPKNLIYLMEYYEDCREYDVAKREYDRIKRNGIIVGSTLSAVSLAYIIFTCTHKLKFKEKTLLSRVTPSIDPINSQFCIRLRLQ